MSLKQARKLVVLERLSGTLQHRLVVDMRLAGISAIDVLLGCKNQTKAGEILNVSWDEAYEKQKRAISRGLSRRENESLSYIGIDKKSFLNEQLLYKLFWLMKCKKGSDEFHVIMDSINGQFHPCYL